MRILVLGYYFSQNLGDDAFQVALPLILGGQNRNVIKFVSIDQMQVLRDVDPNEHFDVILLGAGDVVTPYFFKRVNAYVERFKRGPYVLFGAGLTYRSCVQLGHLDQFDRVFLRNTTDLRLAERRLGTMSAHYIPDIVFALEPAKLASKIDVASKRPRAAFYLIQSIDVERPSNAQRQAQVLSELARCVSFVAETHDVVLLRFNTSRTRGGDDIHISTKVAKMTGLSSERVFVDTEAYATPDSMLKRMGDFDVNICMRFHAHVFSVVQQVPFVSLTLTRKVTMLMDELGLADDCGVRLPFDCETLQPIDVPYEEFCRKFAFTVANASAIKQRLRALYEERHSLLKSGVYLKILESHCARPNPVRPGRQIFVNYEDVTENPVEKSKLNALLQKAEKWWKKAFGYSLLEGESRAAQNLAQRRASETLRAEDSGNRSLRRNSVPTTASTANSDAKKTLMYNNRSQSDQTVQTQVTKICERIAFSITNQVQSKFLYGFVENMLKDPFQIHAYVEWMLKEQNSLEVTKEQSNLFNLDFTQQLDFTGSHRSGWSFVVAHLRALHSEKGVLLDTCMDRTFHWGCDVLKEAGLLPFTHSWCGIVHHTPLESYTDYNTTAMMRNPTFLASLATCRGIYVLSEYLRQWFLRAFAEAGITKVPPVCTLIHPTEFVAPQLRFTLPKFLGNADKKLINIGAWMRDTFAIYRLGLLDTAAREVSGEIFEPSAHGFIEEIRRRIASRQNRTIRYELRRCMLHGPNMNLYMPPPRDQLVIATRDSLQQTEPDLHVSLQGCRHEHCSVELASSEEYSYGSDDTCSKKRKRKGDQCEDDDADYATASGTSTASLIQANQNIYETKRRNKWIQGLHDFVDESVYATVNVLERLSDKEYDSLLQENIVFLYLVDASACNTLIECVVRDAPLLINRLPAAVEILGADYPFFYDSLADALQISRSYEKMAQAHEHMKKIRKEKFSIEYFIDQIKVSEIYSSLRVGN